jgi:putative ABC transport system substrate-binding protein
MKRALVAVLAVAGGLHAGDATAQPASNPAMIAKLHPGAAADPAQQRFLEAFREGMAQLGHVEGKSFVFVARFAEGDAQRLPALAAELIRLEPAVILAGGTASVRAARDATTTIPIVMATSATDPVAAGFVASLARPGGNVTGFTGQLQDLHPKQIELLRELVPGLADMAVLFNPANAGSGGGLGRIAELAGSAGILLHPFPVTSVHALDALFAAARAGNLGGALVVPEPLIMDRNRARIAELALRYRLPAIYSFRTYAEAGGLASYAEDLVDMHRRSALFVDRILKGAKPADLPVEQPTKFELVVNLKTAKAIGITVPQSILLRADEVIE